MARTTEQLIGDRERLSSELEQVRTDLAIKVADGGDYRNLSAKRDRLESRLRDLEPAIEIARAREAEANAKRAADEQEAALANAKQAATALTDAATVIDNALAELEGKFAAFGLARIDAERALRKAGLDDGSKIKRTVGHALRWATWASAPEFAADSQLPRVEINKRRSFKQTIAAAIPRIE